MSEQLQAIHTALQYIEDHLHDEIAVADIAAATGYSLYHFIRTFNQAVHHTPYDYLMRRRLSEAACALLDSDDRIIDIALDYQFNNHETFSRAFKRMFDTQPSQWREVGRIPRRSLMPALKCRPIVGRKNRIERNPLPRVCLLLAQTEAARDHPAQNFTRAATQ